MMLHLSIVAAMSVLTTASAAYTEQDQGLWVIPMMRPILEARMDPIIEPGSVSGHVHTVMGASNFRNVLNTPEEQQKAACTTAPLQADKSNYWAPTLFHINKENKYEAMSAHTRAYYFINGENVQPFPPGMRMVTGNAMTRDQYDERTRGVLLDCDGQNKGSWLPNGTSFPNGCNDIHLSISFPSCGWANQSLDSHDHWSHLTWPIGTGGGIVWQDQYAWACPESHPIKYPHVFLESLYFPNQRQKSEWRGGHDEISLILANGDTTGNTFHADFVNGWDHQVLSDAIAQCGKTGRVNVIGDDLQRCAPFAPHYDVEASGNCRYQGMIPDEQVGFFEPLDALPGCNPRWGRDDPPTKPSCAKPASPQWIAPEVAFADFLTENLLPAKGVKSTNGSWADPLAGKQAYTVPWGQTGNMRFNQFKSNNPIITSNATSGPASLVVTGPSNDCKVAGFTDTSPFSQVDSGSPAVAENRWELDFAMPNVTQTGLIGDITTPSDHESAQNVNLAAASAPTASLTELSTPKIDATGAAGSSSIPPTASAASRATGVKRSRSRSRRM